SRCRRSVNRGLVGAASAASFCPLPCEGRGGGGRGAVGIAANGGHPLPVSPSFARGGAAAEKRAASAAPTGGGESDGRAQHSMTFTARPPREVSLYLSCMSRPVSRMVLMTLSSETLCLPSPRRAMREAL